jgi:hypothetical protein
MLRRAFRAGHAQVSQKARHLVGRSAQDRRGAKIFASPADESERQFALSQVQTSMRLHRTQRVMLMAHSDCGAYGGLQAFAGDEEREAGAPRSRVARCRGVFEIQGAEH